MTGNRDRAIGGDFYSARDREEFRSDGVRWEAFDDSVVHVLAVDYLSQFREGSHVELLLGGEALEGGLLRFE